MHHEPHLCTKCPGLAIHLALACANPRALIQ